jgi:hypothetical protein
MWLFIAKLIHIVDYVKLIFSTNGAALNARAAPLRSAETVFCFSFQPNDEITRSAAIGCIDFVKRFLSFFLIYFALPVKDAMRHLTNAAKTMKSRCRPS